MELKVHHRQYTKPYPAHTTALVAIPPPPIMLIQKLMKSNKFLTKNGTSSLSVHALLPGLLFPSALDQ
jgi:hypothetical protein